MGAVGSIRQHKASLQKYLHDFCETDSGRIYGAAQLLFSCLFVCGADRITNAIGLNFFSRVDQRRFGCVLIGV